MKKIKMTKDRNEMTLTILKWLAIAVLFVALVLAIPVMGGALIGGVVGSLIGITGVGLYYQRGFQGSKINLFQQTRGRIGSSIGKTRSKTRSQTKRRSVAKAKVKSKAKTVKTAKTGSTAKVVHLKHKTATQAKRRRHA